MDPVTVLSLVEACAGLTVTAGKLAIGLRTVATNYKHAALTFRSLSNQCKLFACSARAIQQWMEDGANQDHLDKSTQEQLMDSLECANDVIYALQAELVETSGGTINTFWEKINVIWNQQNLKLLEDTIHKQTTGMAVILQIMNLPTPQAQKRDLSEKGSVFQDSRTSALSICDPESSTHHASYAASTIRASTAVTNLSRLPSFDFDDVLMSSQVYLRNRNNTLALKSSSPSGPSVGNTRDAGTDMDWNDSQRLNNEHMANLEDKSREWLLAYCKVNIRNDWFELNQKYRKVKGYYFADQIRLSELNEIIEKLMKGGEVESGDYAKLKRHEEQPAGLAQSNGAGQTTDAESSLQRADSEAGLKRQRQRRRHIGELLSVSGSRTPPPDLDDADGTLNDLEQTLDFVSPMSPHIT